MLPKRWDSVIDEEEDYIEVFWTDNLRGIKVLVKNIVCITIKMTPADCIQSDHKVDVPSLL